VASDRSVADELADVGRARLALLYALIYAEIGIATPFLPLWLNSLQLDPATIGIIIATPIFVKVLASVPLSSLIDTGVNPRALLLAGSMTVAMSYAIMPSAAKLGWPVLAVVLAIGAAAGSALIPTVDYLALRYVRLHPETDYARIRMSGSIAFLAVTIAGGMLLDASSTAKAIPQLLSCVAVCGATASFFMRPVRAGPPTASGRQTPGAIPRRLWFFMCAAAAIQASHAALYGFATIFWAAHANSDLAIGIFWGLGVGSEILIFAAARRFPRLITSPEKLLLIGGAAAISRAIGMALVGQEPCIIVVLQALHGLSFGVTHIGIMTAVSVLGLEQHRGRAQGTLTTLTAGGTACASILSGFVYQRFGGSVAFAAMAPIALLGLSFLMTGARVRKDT